MKQVFGVLFFLAVTASQAWAEEAAAPVAPTVSVVPAAPTQRFFALPRTRNLVPMQHQPAIMPSQSKKAYNYFAPAPPPTAADAHAPAMAQAMTREQAQQILSIYDESL